ncbi:MAG: PcfJ domain-containing protein [Saprospiraceae bacterium]|nr:PcfJ domain-containing protein [Saprospiraceae bacterium]
MAALQNCPATACLLRTELQAPLSALLTYEQANTSSLQRALNPEQLFLQSFFQTLLDAGCTLPSKPKALHAFLRIASQGLPFNELCTILQTQMLDRLTYQQLQSLPYQHLRNLQVLVEVYAIGSLKLSPLDVPLVVDLFSCFYPHELREKQMSQLILTFFRNVWPAFIQKFEPLVPQARELLTAHPEKVKKWLLVWKNHHLKLVPDLAASAENKHPYYQMDFETIIRYVPAHLWFNDGLPYGDNVRAFGFDTPGFIHLASGGSIRKGADHRPYTRRMAKILMELPFDFDTTGLDMYIYAFTRSLGASEQLSSRLQSFIRHPDNTKRLQEELDNWQPIVQRLNVPEFEQLSDEYAATILGYVYHCIRDQPGFNQRKASLNQLRNETNAYQYRIRQRLAERLEKEREKQERSAKNWASFTKIKGMDVKVAASHFRIHQLLSTSELQQEGRVMQHCVGGYGHKCQSGLSTIWSLRECKDGNWKSQVTIEIINNRIVQASAKNNARPAPEHTQLIRSWARRENIQLA